MRRERGSVTIHAIAVGAVLGLLAGVIVQATVLIRLQHEVAKAADLSALAASRALELGEGACQAAHETARRNHAEVVSCRMDMAVATITARGESKTLWGQRFAFEVKARAAPLSYLED